MFSTLTESQKLEYARSEVSTKEFSQDIKDRMIPDILNGLNQTQNFSQEDFSFLTYDNLKDFLLNLHNTITQHHPKKNIIAAYGTTFRQDEIFTVKLLPESICQFTGQPYGTPRFEPHIFSKTCTFITAYYEPAIFRNEPASSDSVYRAIKKACAFIVCQLRQYALESHDINNILQQHEYYSLIETQGSVFFKYSTVVKKAFKELTGKENVFEIFENIQSIPINKDEVEICNLIYASPYASLKELETETPKFLTWLLENLKKLENNTVDATVFAAKAHQKITHLHLFNIDMNGTMARLIGNLILLKKDLPLVNFKKNNFHQNYTKIAEESDKTIVPLVTLFKNFCLNNTLSKNVDRQTVNQLCRLASQGASDALIRQASEIAKKLGITLTTLLNIPYEKGFGPLHYAIHKDQFETAKILIEHGADPFLTVDGKTSAFDLLTRKKQPEATGLKELIEKKYEISNENSQKPPIPTK